ncbi:hypothetical protein EDD30_3842 [Couchioplanes caeruleus]|uniref:Lipoprotein n=1 Tax=Couchioplanes caeruleus TaxID=56438 RepID=A0A3N1GKZ3_9ACTN|nr:hypothetical protein EDD30_3842 [Couchioplanes caeruleus]
MRRALLAKLIASSIFIILNSGCGNAPTQGEELEPGWINSEQVEAEYRDEASKLALAPGWKWPEGKMYEEESSNSLSAYRLNTGRSDATLYWFCSWGRQYFEKMAPEGKEIALAQILKVRETVYFTAFLEGQDKLDNERSLSALQDGDSVAFRAIVDANCPRSNRSG